MQHPNVQTPLVIPFTQEAFAKLQADFDRFTIERAAVMERLQIAREQGDLSENGAYKYAKFELGNLNRRLAQLRHLLEHGKVVQKPTAPTTVQFGCTVTLQNGNKTQTYLLVSEHESNPLEGKLSQESPLGQALLGKSVGQTATVTTPRQETTYTILEIS
jgi:transcription elongation factor GreA